MTPLEKVWQRLADREAARMRDAFLIDPNVRRDTRSMAAFALSGLVLAIYLCACLLGVWFALRTVGLLGPDMNTVARVFNGVIALTLLGFSWLARPRFETTEGIPINTQDTPHFHALVGQIATTMQVPMPQRITLLPYVNAFMGRSGFPPQPALGYGLPLWYALHPQERVAIIAHELAHQRNGDPTRSGLVGAALNVLAHSVNVLTPDSLMQANLGDTPFAFMGNGLMRLLSLIPLGLYTAIVNLVGADQQRAEFQADLLAAQVAGTQATTSALDKLHLSNALESAVHKQKHMPERQHAFLELRHIWDTMTDEQRQHRRAEYAAQRLRLDASHPPTTDRIAVVNAHPYQATVTLDSKTAAFIDLELQAFVPALADMAYLEYQERYAY